MFTQFRVRYPQGSLITELLAIDHGQYIVRCLVQVEGNTLVTALAAASTVELAEDQARQRALGVLEMENSPSTHHPEPPMTHVPVSMPTPPTPADSFFSQSQETTQPPAPRSKSKAKKSTNGMALSDSRHERIEEAETPNVVAVEERTFTHEFPTLELVPPQEAVEPADNLAKADQELGLSSDLNPLNQEDTELDSSVTVDTLIDFSEIIAKTNVEIRRLGWTQQQGKDYLVQTYGKRSRQLLTDDELLDFLRHLESEPSPE